MRLLPDVVAGKIGLLVGPTAERAAMLKITAFLAMRGAVRVLDGGNSFDAYQVARHLRRQTPHLDQALDRITVARAFTCYQVLSLFEGTPATQAPQLALDILSTFCDESVSVAESERLLRLVVGHLHRLRGRGAVLVSSQPPQQAERRGLLEIIGTAADHVYINDAPGPVPSAPTLFEAFL